LEGREGVQLQVIDQQSPQIAGGCCRKDKKYFEKYVYLPRIKSFDLIGNRPAALANQSKRKLATSEPLFDSAIVIRKEKTYSTASERLYE
jgi:hypothetical protein